MSACFGDTSYFLALAIPNDESHTGALRWAQTSREPLVTSEYVLIEIGNYLAAPRTRRLFQSIHAALTHDPRVTIVPATSERLKEGMALYIDRPDKSWSLTDCPSFVIMKEQGIQEALTTDHHFEQAGYVALLRMKAATE